MKQFTLGSILIFALAACSNPVSTMKKSDHIVEFNCDKGFKVSFEEMTTITEKDSTTKITVSVKSKNFTKDLEMEQVRSGSGAKYATKDGKYIYWEHQGEVIFGT
jgi:membrane-bound inhibitor of C-type lysozyme